MGKGRSAVRGLGAAHEQRRRDILDAVFTIVDTEGTEQVSIRRVADAAGVSVGRVQHYFRTKDDLLAEAFTTINSHGTGRVHERLSSEDSAADPQRVLTVMLGELIPRTADDCRLVRVAQAFETYAHTRPQLKERLTQGYDELAALLAHLLHASVHPQTGDAEHVLETFRTDAYELLALATGLAGLVVIGNLDAQQAHTIATTRLDEVLSARRGTGSQHR